jgi:hypothetical protein
VALSLMGPKALQAAEPWGREIDLALGDLDPEGAAPAFRGLDGCEEGLAGLPAASKRALRRLLEHRVTVLRTFTPETAPLFADADQARQTVDCMIRRYDLLVFYFPRGTIELAEIQILWRTISPQGRLNESLESLLNDHSPEAAKEEWWRNAARVLFFFTKVEALIANAKSPELEERRGLLRRIKSGLDYIEGRLSELAVPAAPNPTEQARLLADLAYRAGAVLLWMHELHLGDLRAVWSDDAYDYLVQNVTRKNEEVAGRSWVVALSTKLRQLADLRAARANPTLGESLNLSRIVRRQTVLEEIYLTNYAALSEVHALDSEWEKDWREFARMLEIKKELLVQQGMARADAERSVAVEMAEFVAAQTKYEDSVTVEIALERQAIIERLILHGMDLGTGGQ